MPQTSTVILRFVRGPDSYRDEACFW